MPKKTQICSIFGQIEAVVANAMVGEKKLTKIEPELIPPTARFNDKDEAAYFAVVVPAQYAGEFERRIRELRA